MSYVWDRLPIMSNEELEELFMKPAIQERTLQPRREMNYSAFLAILGYFRQHGRGGGCWVWRGLAFESLAHASTLQPQVRSMSI